MEAWHQRWVFNCKHFDAETATVFFDIIFLYRTHNLPILDAQDNFHAFIFSSCFTKKTTLCCKRASYFYHGESTVPGMGAQSLRRV